MIKPKMLVTGATGKTGSAVVTELLAQGWPVRAAVRVRAAPRAHSCPPSVDDIARVAVTALLDAARHAGKGYRPTGPELLTVTEMPPVVARVVGHHVRHVRPLRMFYKAAQAPDKEPILLSGLRHYFQDHGRGAFAVGAPNDTIRELTGKDAENFETSARRHAASSESRQSAGARLAAFTRFMAAPILPGLDPVICERAQEQPVPAAPHLALGDAGWRASHGVEGSFTVPLRPVPLGAAPLGSVPIGATSRCANGDRPQ